MNLIELVDTPEQVTEILDAFYKQYQLSPNFKSDHFFNNNITQIAFNLIICFQFFIKLKLTNKN